LVVKQLTINCLWKIVARQASACVGHWSGHARLSTARFG